VRLLIKEIPHCLECPCFHSRLENNDFVYICTELKDVYDKTYTFPKWIKENTYTGDIFPMCPLPKIEPDNKI
jgi:hypothetical protein